METKQKNAIKGALYGVAIGDALGAPLEFMSAKEIVNRHGKVTEMIGGGWLNVSPGEITDDTQMTLAVAEGIIENPDNPIEAIGERFIAWARSGPKDIGGTCSRSIYRAAREGPKRPTEAAWFNASKDTAKSNGRRSGGNGALMRTVYPGLYYQGRLMAVETSAAIAQMTHWDDESNEACELYTDMIHLLTEAVYKQPEARSRIIDETLQGTRYQIDRLRHEKGDPEPTGYVVDSMECALAAFYSTNSFEGAIVEAANMGGDADTIAAITGGLAGAYYGYEAIPDRWIKSLEPDIRKQLDTLAEAAVANRAAKQKER